MTTTIAHGGVTANAKTLLGRIKYALGKFFPSWVGQPFHMTITITHADGTKEARRVFNTVTTAGRNGIADQILASPTLGKPTHMAVGTGTGGTTTLNAEVDRNALTSKLRSGAVVTMIGDWAAGDATAALTEAGVLTASTSGDLWLYTTFAVVNKAAADALQIQWTLTIS